MQSYVGEKTYVKYADMLNMLNTYIKRIKGRKKIPNKVSYLINQTDSPFSDSLLVV